MPRMKGCRRICGTPAAYVFKPRGIPMSELDTQTLALDEFEAIRLADYEGMYHDQAAQEMGISRQSFGLIIKAARKKLASAVIRGMALEILSDPGAAAQGCTDRAESIEGSQAGFQEEDR